MSYQGKRFRWISTTVRNDFPRDVYYCLFYFPENARKIAFPDPDDDVDVSRERWDVKIVFASRLFRSFFSSFRRFLIGNYSRWLRLRWEPNIELIDYIVWWWRRRWERWNETPDITDSWHVENFEYLLPSTQPKYVWKYLKTSCWVFHLRLNFSVCKHRNKFFWQTRIQFASSRPQRWL